MTEINSPNSLVPVIPFGPGETEIHLEDDDGNAVVVSSLEELVRDTVDLNNAQFNIENSNNVVVGPYFSGLTVHQHFVGLPEQIQALSNNNNNSNADQSQTNNNAKLVSTENQPKEEKEFGVFHIPKRFTLILSVAVVWLLAVSGIIIVTVFFSSNQKQLNIPTTNGAFVTKSEWGGQKSRSNNLQLHHPVPLVIIKHTAGSICTNFHSCSEKVRNIQIDHLSRNFSDIYYNFLIGGDGKIYVGRGWDIQNSQQDNSIDVSFIGNFVVHTLSASMINALNHFLSEGVKIGVLDKNYKLVAHNQTSNTKSPGQHVFGMIKNLSHFDSNY